jgi:hypothetical protein
MGLIYVVVSPSGTVVTKKDLRRSKISRTLAQIMPSNNDSAWSEVEFK